MTNAARVIAACDEFHAANGRFPNTLDELVPRYMPFIPRAKYCLDHGEFCYLNPGGHPTLHWCVISPFTREAYSFEDRRWRYID